MLLIITSGIIADKFLQELIISSKDALIKPSFVILSLGEGSYTTALSISYGVQDPSLSLRMTPNQSIPDLCIMACCSQSRSLCSD